MVQYDGQGSGDDFFGTFWYALASPISLNPACREFHSYLHASDADGVHKAQYPERGRDGRRHPPHGFTNSRDGDRGGRTGTLAFRYDYRQQ